MFHTAFSVFVEDLPFDDLRGVMMHAIVVHMVQKAWCERLKYDDWRLGRSYETRPKLHLALRLVLVFLVA